MTHHLLQASIVAAVGAAAFSGCGGDDDGDRDGPRYSVETVRERFRALTDVDLVARTLNGTTTLSLPSGVADEGLARTRFGGTEIIVAADEDDLDDRRASSSSRQTVTVGNVLVRSGYSDDDTGFRRVVRIVRSLPQPLSAVRLPAEDTLCERAGIDPDGGDTRTGTCVTGQQLVTVVGPRDELRLPTVAVSRPALRVIRTLPADRSPSGGPVRATGEFVVVRAHVENTSNAPLDRLPADLVINGRRYAPDARNGYAIQRDAFPIQPGGVATLTFLYDIPRTADDPGTGGALQLSGDAQGLGSPDRSPKVGRIRLPPAA